MDISSSFEPIGPDRLTRAKTSDHERSDRGKNIQPVGSGLVHSAPVEISALGRSRTEQADRMPEMDPDRVTELRARARAHAYDTPNVLDQVARRILCCGDL